MTTSADIISSSTKILILFKDRTVGGGSSTPRKKRGNLGNSHETGIELPMLGHTRIRLSCNLYERRLETVYSFLIEILSTTKTRKWKNISLIFIPT